MKPYESMEVIKIGSYMEFTSFRLVTNGEKFRIEGKYLTTEKGEQWTLLSTQYWGASAYGYNPTGHIYEFNTRLEAVEHIRKEYGESGYRKLLNNWWVC